MADIFRADTNPSAKQMPSYVSSGTTIEKGVFAYQKNKLNMFAVASLVIISISGVIALILGYDSVYMIPAIPISLVMAGYGWYQIKKNLQIGKQFVLVSIVVNILVALLILGTGDVAGRLDTFFSPQSNQQLSPRYRVPNR